MNTGMIFLLLVALGSIVVVALAFYPLLKAPKESPLKSTDALEITRNLLKELEADRSRGELTEAEFIAQREELVLRLAQEEEEVTPAAVSVMRSRGLFIALVVLLPVLSGVGYWALGSPAGLSPHTHSARAGAEDITPEQIQKFIDGLEVQLQKNPADAQGAALLARAYSFQNNMPKALETFKKAVQLNPKDPELLTDYADLRVTAANGLFDQETLSILQAALKASPGHIKALALLGTAAFNSENYKEAVAAWSAALPRAAREAPQWVGEFIQNIEEANQKAGGRAISVAELNALKVKYAPKALIGGRIEVDADVRSQFSEDSQVFIFAKALEGPPMPVAVLRVTLKDLPLDFKLTDADSVMPTRKLSDLKKVLVGARISKSGSATPGPGDVSSPTAPVELGTLGLKIKIKAQ